MYAYNEYNIRLKKVIIDPYNEQEIVFVDNVHVLVRDFNKRKIKNVRILLPPPPEYLHL